ncbi:hypothetical protein, partial [Acrocarpospora sp. B8E8]|uniref:hypothetical protein n=1 Tax=Acrocarpospora sp. B8E8 TaxID=3153572 RepID=UPI00325CCD3F
MTLDPTISGAELIMPLASGFVSSSGSSAIFMDQPGDGAFDERLPLLTGTTSSACTGQLRLAISRRRPRFTGGYGLLLTTFSPAASGNGWLLLDRHSGHGEVHAASVVPVE